MEVLQRLARLLDVKSLVTLALTGVFVWLCATGRIGGDQFLTVFTVVISFYFGVQMERRRGGGGGQ